MRTLADALSLFAGAVLGEPLAEVHARDRVKTLGEHAVAHDAAHDGDAQLHQHPQAANLAVRLDEVAGEASRRSESVEVFEKGGEVGLRGLPHRSN